jgi:hypothetical protein
MKTTNYIKELRIKIANSLYKSPAKEDEINEREEFKNISQYGISMQLQALDREGATIYDENDVISISEEWAKENLKARKKKKRR